MRHQPSVVPTELLPDGLTAIVAGGYAACPALASDMDVWVMNAAPLPVTRQRILDHLYSQAGNWVMGVVVQPESTASQSIVDGDGYDELPVNVLKVAVVQFPGMLPIHIMVTDVDSPVALMLSFDISTHQVAIGQHDDVIYGPHWTPLEAEPEVLRSRFNPKTIARLEKITTRYAHLRQEDHAQAV